MPSTIKIKVKRFDKSVPLPERKSGGAACIDLYARTNAVVEPLSFGYVPLNVAIQIPKGHWALLAVRSSLHKQGLIPGNGIGIGDEDFSGDNDEYQLIVFNTTKKPVRIAKATRVAQMMVLQYNVLEIEEVDSMGNKTRGGLGSTGKH